MADPTIPELAKNLADTQTALNIVWTMVAGFLVMFMQAGFALVETGLTRAKNAAHTMGMNFLVYAIGIIGFYFVGFGLQMGGVGAMGTFGNEALLSKEFVVTLFGKDFGLFGMTGFMLPLAKYTPAVAAMFLFQMVFMDTTATIPTGAAAERWKFTSFVAFSFVISTIIYPIYANWVWGGGWLSALGTNFGLGHGHVDFAGSSVVHMTGGVSALVLARMIGPRLGKYSPDGRINPIAPQSIPQVLLGTFILAFGRWPRVLQRIVVAMTLPLVLGLGYDGVWFGIFVTVMCTIGLISPPTGMTVFVIQAQHPDIPVARIYLGTLPFLVADFVLIGLLVMLPGMVSWLPSLLKI